MNPRHVAIFSIQLSGLLVAIALARPAIAGDLIGSAAKSLVESSEKYLKHVQEMETACANQFAQKAQSLKEPVKGQPPDPSSGTKPLGEYWIQNAISISDTLTAYNAALRQLKAADSPAARSRAEEGQAKMRGAATQLETKCVPPTTPLQQKISQNTQEMSAVAPPHASPQQCTQLQGKSSTVSEDLVAKTKALGEACAAKASELRGLAGQSIDSVGKSGDQTKGNGEERRPEAKNTPSGNNPTPQPNGSPAPTQSPGAAQSPSPSSSPAANQGNQPNSSNEKPKTNSSPSPSPSPSPSSSPKKKKKNLEPLDESGCICESDEGQLFYCNGADPENDQCQKEMKVQTNKQKFKQATEIDGSN